MSASSAINREVASELKTGLEKLGELIKDKFKDDETISSGIDQLKVTLGFSTKEPSEFWLDKLDARHSAFKPAKVLLSSIVAKYQKKNRERIAANLEPFPPEDSFIFENGAYYEIDTTNGKKVEQPLIFADPVSLEIFRKNGDIKRSPYSKVLDLPRTLMLIMDHAQRIGFTRQMLSQIFQMLVTEELPEHADEINIADSPAEVWDCILSLINFSAEKDKVVAAMKKIVRPPGQKLSKSTQAYKTLCKELLRMEYCNLTEEQIKEKAEFSTKKIIKHLVEKDMYTQLQKYVHLRRTKMKKDTSLSERVKFVEKEEYKFELRSEKSLTDKDVTINLHHINVDIGDCEAGSIEVNDEDEKDGIEGVGIDHNELFMIKTGNQIMRTPPPAPPPALVHKSSDPPTSPHKSGVRTPLYENEVRHQTRQHGEPSGGHTNLHAWGDKPGLVDGGRSRDMTPQVTGHRARSVERGDRRAGAPENRRPARNDSRSPTSGQRRMIYKSPGGTYRSISRGRLRYADSKDGFRPRPPSQGTRFPSGDRVSCLICGDPSHNNRDGFCKVFGRSKATKRYCGRCYRSRQVKAFHSEEACSFPVTSLSQSQERKVHYIEVDQAEPQGNWQNIN